MRGIKTMSTTPQDRPQERLVMDAGDIARSVTRIAHEILERNKDVAALALVGIRTGGVHLAHRLVRRIQEIEAASVPIGELGYYSLSGRPLLTEGATDSPQDVGPV